MKIAAFTETSPSAIQQKDRQPPGRAVAEEAVAKRPQETGQTRAENVRHDLNKSIVESSMKASLSAGNEPLALLYKTAIENLNEILAPELGPNAIQQAYESGLDVSPEATAERIVSFATGFFQAYQGQHPDKDLDTAVKDFVELIGGGIDKGFAEARQILDGLGVLQGDIAANIDKTYELVQQGLKAFVESFSAADDE